MTFFLILSISLFTSSVLLISIFKLLKSFPNSFIFFSMLPFKLFDISYLEYSLYIDFNVFNCSSLADLRLRLFCNSPIVKSFSFLVNLALFLEAFTLLLNLSILPIIPDAFFKLKAIFSL